MINTDVGQTVQQWTRRRREKVSVFDDGTAAKLSAHLDLSKREKVFLFSWKQQAQLVLSMMYLTVSKSKVTILALPGEMKLCEKVQVSDFSLKHLYAVVAQAI